MRFLNFSLLEVILIVTIIAITASLLIPLMDSVSEKAKNNLMTSEMSKIQKAFIQLDNDCVLGDEQLQEIEKYGLWPLMQMSHPVDFTKSYPEFSLERQKGWRGKYMEKEATKIINPLLEGQPEALKGGTEIPVIKDPYSGYYRVIVPAGESVFKITLICTGKNNLLETTSFNKDANGKILPVNDDSAIRLLPLK